MRRAERLILISMCLSLAAVVSAVSSLNVALPDLAHATGASTSELQWIVDAYALVFAGCCSPPARSATGSAGGGSCSSASPSSAAPRSSPRSCHDPDTLIGVRAVMGLGAAMIMPTTLSIITATFPPATRDRAVGVWAGVAGGSALRRPARLRCAARVVRTGRRSSASTPRWRDRRRDDAALRPGARRPRPTPLDAGRRRAVGARPRRARVGLHRGPEARLDVARRAGRLRRRRRAADRLRRSGSCAAREPMLDPRLFRLRGFATGSLSVFVQFFALFGVIFVVLQYLQFVLALLAARGGRGAGAHRPADGRRSPRGSPRLVDRVGVRPVGPVGLGLIAAGLARRSRRMGVDASYWHLLAGLVLLGIGMALADAARDRRRSSSRCPTRSRASPRRSTTRRARSAARSASPCSARCWPATSATSAR